MSKATRVSAMWIADACFAVLHRDGEDDEIMDGPDGRPMAFTSALAAINAGKAAAGIASAPVQSIEDGIAAWRAQKRREAAEERARVFGRTVAEVDDR